MNQLVDNLTKYPLLFYSVYFLLVFVQYPINNSLPGHSDTMYNLAIFNDYIHRIDSFINSSEIGRAYYPEIFYEAFTELYIGHALIFIPFKLIGLSDIWAYYLFVTIVFSLNGWACYKFFEFLGFSKYVSVLGGFIFSTSAFAIGQIELLNGIPYFLFFLAFIKFIQYIQHQKVRDLYLASIIIGIQFYFSIYITVYFIFICLAIYLYYILKRKINLSTLFPILICVMICMVISLPYLYFMVNYGFIQGGYSVITFENVNQFSLHWKDLIRPLPSHTFYKDLYSEENADSFRIVSYGFMGISFWLLCFLGLFKTNKKVLKFIALFLILGIIFSAGPYFYNGKINIPAPLYPFYKDLGFAGALRIASRAYSLIILAGIFLILSYFESIPTKGIKNIFITIFILLFFFENVPLKLPHNQYAKHLNLPKQLDKYLQSKHNKNVILTLPSSLFSGKTFRYDGMSEHSREELYLYWQTIHKKNTVNGIASYMSFYRKEVDDLIHQYDWEKLNIKYDVNSFIFLKEYVIEESENQVLQKLIESDNLRTVYEDESIVIFEHHKDIS